MLDLRGIVFSILVNHLLYLCNELNYRISIVHDPCKCSFAQALIRIEIFPSFTSSTNVALEFKIIARDHCHKITFQGQIYAM